MEGSINVQEIMAEITGEEFLKVKTEKNKETNGYIRTLQEVLQINREQRESNSISYLMGHWNVAYYREIDNSKWIKFVKRVIRKLIKFCIVPIVEDQNAINANVLQVLNAQKSEISVLEKKVILLENEISKLKDNRYN